MTTITIGIGSAVRWTVTRSSRRSMSMTLREGVVEALNGAQATVKLKSGRRADVAIAELSTHGQPTVIGSFVEALRAAHRPDETTR